MQPFEGRRDAQRTSADEAKEIAREADLDGPLVDWREKGHRVEYLGTEDVDGTPAHKLRVTRKDGDTQYVYLDPDHWLEIRIVTETRVRGVERVTETDLGTYEQVAGVWIPMSRESGREGRAAPPAHHDRARRGRTSRSTTPLFKLPAAGPRDGARDRRRRRLRRRPSAAPPPPPASTPAAR